MPLLGFKIRVLQTDQGSHGNIAHLLNLLLLISNTQLNLITLLLLILLLPTNMPHRDPKKMGEKKWVSILVIEKKGKKNIMSKVSTVILELIHFV